MASYRVRAGAYRHFISLYRPVNSGADVKGDFLLDYSLAFQEYAFVEPLGGSEYWLAQQVRSDSIINIECRYLPGVDTNWRIVWEGQIYDITNISSIEERDRKLVFIANQRGPVPDDQGTSLVG